MGDSSKHTATPLLTNVTKYRFVVLMMTFYSRSTLQFILSDSIISGSWWWKPPIKTGEAFHTFDFLQTFEILTNVNLFSWSDIGIIWCRTSSEVEQIRRPLFIVIPLILGHMLTPQPHIERCAEAKRRVQFLAGWAARSSRKDCPSLQWESPPTRICWNKEDKMKRFAPSERNILDGSWCHLIPQFKWSF